MWGAPSKPVAVDAPPPTDIPPIPQEGVTAGFDPVQLAQLAIPQPRAPIVAPQLMPRGKDPEYIQSVAAGGVRSFNEGGLADWWNQPTFQEWHKPSGGFKSDRHYNNWQRLENAERKRFNETVGKDNQTFLGAAARSLGKGLWSAGEFVVDEVKEAKEAKRERKAREEAEKQAAANAKAKSEAYADSSRAKNAARRERNLAEAKAANVPQPERAVPQPEEATIRPPIRPVPERVVPQPGRVPGPLQGPGLDLDPNVFQGRIELMEKGLSVRDGSPLDPNNPEHAIQIQNAEAYRTPDTLFKLPPKVVTAKKNQLSNLLNTRSNFEEGSEAYNNYTKTINKIQEELQGYNEGGPVQYLRNGGRANITEEERERRRLARLAGANNVSRDIGTATVS